MVNQKGRHAPPFFRLGRKMINVKSVIAITARLAVEPNAAVSESYQAYKDALRSCGTGECSENTLKKFALRFYLECQKVLEYLPITMQVVLKQIEFKYKLV